METTVSMTKLSNICDAYSGVCLADTSSTIASYLSKPELIRYSRAIAKVQTQQKLNLKDLNVLDKIDALTYEHHGMCLKDSLVTNARLNACKKYGVEFVDRDSLVEHMNCMLPSENPREKKATFYKGLGEFFTEKLGSDHPYKLRTVLEKLDQKRDLDLADLIFLSEMESVASQELDWTIINAELITAIDKACKKLGIYFQNLQKVVTH